MRFPNWLGTFGFVVMATVVVASGNELNDRLLKGSDQVRRDVLQFLIADSCHVTRTFFNGIAKRGPAKGRAFWSAQCADGRAFMVMIPPRNEDTRIIECEDLKLLKLNSCFKKLQD